jgi:hypothetical protein
MKTKTLLVLGLVFYISCAHLSYEVEKNDFMVVMTSCKYMLYVVHEVTQLVSLVK